MMSTRILYQRGVYELGRNTYPVFDTPIPPINIGDTVVLKYKDEATEVLTIRPNDSIEDSRCGSCKYGTQTGRCPVHRDAKCDTWDCIFTRGYALSVDDLLVEL